MCVYLFKSRAVCPLYWLSLLWLSELFLSASAFLRFACLHFLLFNLCFTISPVCLLPLISPFLLGFLSSLPLFLPYSLFVLHPQLSFALFLSSPSSCLSSPLCSHTLSLCSELFTLLPTIPSQPSCPSVLASQNIPSLHLFVFPWLRPPSVSPPHPCVISGGDRYSLGCVRVHLCMGWGRRRRNGLGHPSLSPPLPAILFVDSCGGPGGGGGAFQISL